MAEFLKFSNKFPLFDFTFFNPKMFTIFLIIKENETIKVLHFKHFLAQAESLPVYLDMNTPF